jgi:hypothetical protein
MVRDGVSEIYPLASETRSCPEILEKHDLVHSDNHGISVLDPRVHGPHCCGAEHERGWSVKPSLAPRKVEGLGSITKARHGTGKGMALFRAENLVVAWNTFRGSV